MKSRSFWTSVAVFSSMVTLSVSASADDDAIYRAEMETWHHDRAERLTAEDGWLTLICLFWLDAGENVFGSSPDSKLLLPADKAPPRVGTLTLEGNRVQIDVTSGVLVTLAGEPITSVVMAADTTGDPTILDLGELQFLVIERGGQFGLRVRDRANPKRLEFAGIDRYPIDRRWRVSATLERFDPPHTIPIPNVLGMVNQQPSPGTVTFGIEGQTYRIDALEGSDGRLFLIFADATSGHETYGGGRFLYTDPVQEDGLVTIDFNLAYNPPCAFTVFATCPLPPRQNKLTLRITAGEKSYDHH